MAARRHLGVTTEALRQPSNGRFNMFEVVAVDLRPSVPLETEILAFAVLAGTVIRGRIYEGDSIAFRALVSV